MKNNSDNQRKAKGEHSVLRLVRTVWVAAWCIPAAFFALGFLLCALISLGPKKAKKDWGGVFF